MRSEITDMRRTLDELRRRTDIYEPYPETTTTRDGKIAGLLPSKATGEHLFVETEDVTGAGETPSASTGAMTKDEAMRDAIIKALHRTGGRRKEAAALLFISERTLYRKIKELGINEEIDK